MAFEKPKDMDYFAVNHASWDQLADLHFNDENDWYGVKGFLEGEERRCGFDVREMGDLSGKRVLHSQCHFGLDTLSAARFADSVVGLDFSENAVKNAQTLAEKAGLAHKAEFVCANVYDAGKVLEAESFDMIYASWGVTPWLHDLQGWADVLCTLLKPGGTFFYADGHPAAWTLEESDGDQDGPLIALNPYWQTDFISEEWPESYTGQAIPVANSRAVEFPHTLEDFFSVFLKAGMRLTDFKELDAIPWKMFTRMVDKPEDRMFVMPEGQANFPLGFSMKWTKPL